MKAVTISLSKKEATSIYQCLFIEIEILELGLLKRLIKRQDSQTNSM